MRLTIFGAGYVGLVTAAGLADLGHVVLCVDIAPDRIRKLQDGVIPFHEPGLGDLVQRNVRAERLLFATDVAAPFGVSDAYFIAVGTPPREDGSADTSAVLAVGAHIAKIAGRQALVIVKSTVPVGTCDLLQERIGAKTPLLMEVVSNPEFLKEGSALADFFRPDRVVVGARTAEAHAVVRALYAPLQLSGECVVATDPRSSELTKYVANTMLAMRVSMMNEVARLCHATGANVHDVRMGVGSDSRIGRKFLYSGPGYGGSCFPKDVQALVHLGQANGVPMRLAAAAHQANEEQATFLAQLVKERIGDLRGKHVAFWGLAFKPETDDVREAPSVRLARAMMLEGASVRGHDPEAGRGFTESFRTGPPPMPIGAPVETFAREYDALDGADALVLLTEWRCYLAPDFAEIKRRMRGCVVVDARNVWRREDVERAGLQYQGIGIP
jgi:UDPglucose 6-dehydrogenase